MKNLYTTLLVVFMGSLSCIAQTIIYDDFESYPLGNLGCQNPTVWNVCGGDCNNGVNIKVFDFGYNSAQSGYIGPDSAQDALLLLGNQTSGDFTLAFYMYITSGSTGYFNIQGETDILNCGSGTFNSSNLYFNNGGAAPGTFEDQTTGETGTYPEDAWFPVSIYFDLNTSPPTYVITVDDGVVNSSPVNFQADETLGAIDFFSIDALNNYWLDNVNFVVGILDNDDYAVDNFSIAPNPVQDLLQIRSTESVERIEIYDLLGKTVLELTPNDVSPGIDISHLSSGLYLVRVAIGETSRTFKIVK